MRPCFLIHALAAVGFPGMGMAAEPQLGSAGFTPSPERPFGWRGDGSGRFPEADPPTSWSDTKNVRWSAVVGPGYSSPILTDKRVFVASEPDQLLCIDRGDGKVRWKLQIKPADLADAKSRQAAAEYVPPK